MLTILKTLPRTKGVQKQALVQCVCGKEYVIRYADAVRAKSCGCLRSEGAKGVNKKHGLRDHELYGTWRQMMQRCYNESHKQFDGYGGRGISVCSEWHEVSVFIDDIERILGVKTSDETLDRKENNGNYEPDNVKWSTRTEQNRNRRDNLLIEIDGVTLCPSEWADKTGIPRNTIVDRYKVQGLRGSALLKGQRKIKQ